MAALTVNTSVALSQPTVWPVAKPVTVGVGYVPARLESMV